MKVLLGRTDIQVDQPIKKLRRKLDLLNVTRIATEEALFAGYLISEFSPKGEGLPLSRDDLLQSMSRYEAWGRSTGDKQFLLSLRVLEITQRLFLYLDESRHGGIEVPILIEYSWISIFAFTNKFNYAFASSMSRVARYGRSARMNAVIGGARTIKLSDRPDSDGAREFFGAGQEQHVHMFKQTAKQTNNMAQLGVVS